MLRAIALLLSLVFASFPAHAEDYKSAFDRIMATNTLRCGYVVYPPILAKDPNTGKLSGVAYDIVEKMASDLSLKVEWAEEVGFGSWQEGLARGRYDMMCSSAWTTAARARVAAFSVPIFYTAIYGYARTDDHRFDTNLSRASEPSVTAVALDGSMAMSIITEDLPRAKLSSLPDLTDPGQAFIEVQAGKADLTFQEAAQFHIFDSNNPGKLRNITPEKPVRIWANTFFFSPTEISLQNMVNATLSTLHNSGFIDKVLDGHEPAPGTWRRVAQPYR